MEQTDTTYDVIVIGAGPGGLTAALYASRSDLKTLILDSGLAGGQLNNTKKIENYTGFSSIAGVDLAQEMYQSALQFGSQFKNEAVQKLENKGDIKEVQTSKNTYQAKAVIIATGSENKKLGIPGEEEFQGRGVSYCAVCDGAFFRDKEIVVVGGGDSAVEEGTYLTQFASRVTIIHRRDQLKAQEILQDRAFKNDKVDFIWNTAVEEINGEGRVGEVQLHHLDTGERSSLATDGVFVYIGHVPNSEIFANLDITDDAGWIITDERMQTAQAGIFAIGDVRQTPLRQVATAVGDGSIAGYEAYNYIQNL